MKFVFHFKLVILGTGSNHYVHEQDLIKLHLAKQLLSHFQNNQKALCDLRYKTCHIFHSLIIFQTKQLFRFIIIIVQETIAHIILKQSLYLGMQIQNI
jgi:hypothetical protein